MNPITSQMVLKKESIIAVFIPNTYEIYRNTDAGGLYSRMLKEYRTFWNEQRLQKARAEGYYPDRGINSGFYNR